MIIHCNGILRSGSTLQYNIVGNLVEKLGVGRREGGLVAADFSDPAAHAHWESDDLYHVIHMHNLHPRATKLTTAGSMKVCSIYRDIRDVAISLKLKQGWEGEDLFELLDGAVNGYYLIRRIPNVFFQKYEEVMADLPKAITGLAAFLNLTPDQDVVARVAKECSLETATKITKNLQNDVDVDLTDKSTFEVDKMLRKFSDKKTLLHPNHISPNAGASGRWRTELDKAEIDEMMKRYSAWLFETGYLDKSSEMQLLNSAAIMNQAIEQLNAQKSAHALQLFEHAVAFDPNLTKLNFGKAVALVQVGLKEEAIKTLEGLLAVAPDHQRARQLLAELKGVAKHETEPLSPTSARPAEPLPEPQPGNTALAQMSDNEDAPVTVEFSDAHEMLQRLEEQVARRRADETNRHGENLSVEKLCPKDEAFPENTPREPSNHIAELNEKLAEFLATGDGLFVEIGAGDGVSQSYTRSLEKAGWQGILIEPVIENAARCRLNRPRAAVLNYDCTADGDAKTGVIHNEPMAQAAPAVTRGNPRALTSILDELEIDNVDLLVLNARENALNILKGLALSSHRHEYLLVDESLDRNIPLYLTESSYEPCQGLKCSGNGLVLYHSKKNGVPDNYSSDKEKLCSKVASFPFWYHKIDLPYGVVTPGSAPYAPSAYRIPCNLEGKRILDVGAWDGYWTFEALKRGAGEVVAIDDFSDHVGDSFAPNVGDRKGWETFDFCRSVLGHNDSNCKRSQMSVYDIREEEIGGFDIVFFFGTIYHLRYPLFALDRLSSICRHEIYIESAILDDYSPYQGGLGHGYTGEQMVMEFYPENQYGKNETNWWVPTLSCLQRMVVAAGFHNVEGWKLTEDPTSSAFCRGFVRGTKS